jgi:hypothetical protein
MLEFDPAVLLQLIAMLGAAHAGPLPAIAVGSSLTPAAIGEWDLAPRGDDSAMFDCYAMQQTVPASLRVAPDSNYDQAARGKLSDDEALCLMAAGGNVVLDDRPCARAWSKAQRKDERTWFASAAGVCDCLEQKGTDEPCSWEDFRADDAERERLKLAAMTKAEREATVGCWTTVVSSTGAVGAYRHPCP